MMYVIAQICGILASVCCLAPLLKKKWQMLVASIAANLLVAMNLILLGQVSSAVFINLAAVAQLSCSLWHVINEKPVAPTKQIIFMILFLVCGLFGFRGLLDILPIFGSFIFVLSTFERDEQKTRMIALVNAAVYMLYYLIIGATSALSQLVSIIINLAALYAYRKK